MNIRELKEKIAELPEDMVVLEATFDHTFIHAYIGVEKVELTRKGHYNEPNGDGEAYEEGSQIINALIIGSG